MTFSKVRIISAFMSVGMLLSFTPTANAATQKVSYYIDGDCLDYYDEEGEYAFFEDEPDWECYITVLVKPTRPVRTVQLQYWSGTKWKQESISKTSSTGRAYLDFDPICSDGLYCDGEFKYRVYTLAASGVKADYSSNFYVSYYPSEIVDDYVDDSESW
jgi:hypothetical protein